MEAPAAKSRVEKNRESAETSRANKRERMGEEEFLREKRTAAVEYRKPSAKRLQLQQLCRRTTRSRRRRRSRR